MALNLWKDLGKISGFAIMALNIHNAGAGEAWLVITSNLPEAHISVDRAYRGVTPRQPGDALRIQVSAGVRQIHAQKRLGEQEYAAEQTMTAVPDHDNPVQINLVQKAVATVPPATGPSERAKSGMNGPEVPGKNF